MDHIVVIGAGQAGSTLCATLRAEGFEGRVTLIGAETEPPYQRPPLSKKYLMGEMAKERLYLRPESFYADQSIELKTGQTVTAIDPQAQTVTLGDETIGYDALALTTGAAPRRLPPAIGGDLPGVYVVRDLADIDAQMDEYAAGRKVLIVGGGYIGLEAAAVAASRGLDVTLVEAAPRILQRVACPETSDFVRALHQSHGVNILEGVGLDRLTGGDRVSGAVLSDGTELAADFVLAGIGVAARTDLAELAGLDLDHGIVVDDHGRSSDPHIWSAGDCTTFPYRGESTRLESVQNAVDQAEAVAKNILGAGEAYVPKPWFWSDQYDLKLQIAGLNRGYSDVVVRPGAKEGTVSHWYFTGDELLACDALGDARGYMTAKRLIEAGVSPTREASADPGANLMKLLK